MLATVGCRPRGYSPSAPIPTTGNSRSIVHDHNTSRRQFVEDTVKQLLEAGAVHFLMVIVGLLAMEHVQTVVEEAVLTANGRQKGVGAFPMAA